MTGECAIFYALSCWPWKSIWWIWGAGSGFISNQGEQRRNERICQIGHMTQMSDFQILGESFNVPLLIVIQNDLSLANAFFARSILSFVELQMNFTWGWSCLSRRFRFHGSERQPQNMLWNEKEARTHTQRPTHIRRNTPGLLSWRQRVSKMWGSSKFSSWFNTVDIAETTG